MLFLLRWRFTLITSRLCYCCVTDGIKGDDQKRPDSLTSVEEMQGALNYFSKSLLDPHSLSKVVGKVDPQILTSTAQPWIAAAQKRNAPPHFLNAERNPTSPTKNGAENVFAEGESVSADGVEVRKCAADKFLVVELLKWTFIAKHQNCIC